MSVPRTNFRAGDRVRGAEWFEEIRGVTGTVVEAMLVAGQDWAAQDLLVRFDRPVRIFDDEPPTWTFCHSAHNFEFSDESETAPGLPQDLAYSQSAPPPSLLPAHSEPLLPPTSLADNPRPEPRTGYAKKRRLLREHRRNMRIMDELVDEHGLSSELEERLVDETGNTNFFLGEDAHIDEDSDQGDPEALTSDTVLISSFARGCLGRNSRDEEGANQPRGHSQPLSWHTSRPKHLETPQPQDSMASWLHGRSYPPCSHEV